MINLQHKDLLNAGVHLGHLASKWHPHMAPFIFMERNGIHIIDLNKTLLQLQEATHALRALASAGRRILFVATKKQVKSVVEQEAKRLGMPYVTERWLGGTLTNFATIRRLLKKMSSFDKLMKDASHQNMAKKEQLMIAREKKKLEQMLQGIADTTRLPSALFIVDIRKEHIAVKEAQKLGIPIFALTDTNTDPTCVDYPIPSNDDASRCVELIIKAIGSAIEEGLEERQKNREGDIDTTERVTKPNKGTRGKNVEKVASSESVENQVVLARKITKPTISTAQKAATSQVTLAKEIVSTKTVTTAAVPEKKIRKKAITKETIKAQEPKQAVEEEQIKKQTPQAGANISSGKPKSDSKNPEPENKTL